MTNQTDAQHMWETLRSNLLDARKALTQIIETEAWKPLGYTTLREAWTDRMTDVELSVTGTVIELVYAMLAEDGTDMEIADAVKGVGPTIVATLRRQRDNGVPAELASLRPYNRAHSGGSSDSGGTLFLHPGSDKLAAWQRAAATLDRKLADLAIELIDEALQDE